MGNRQRMFGSTEAYERALAEQSKNRARSAARVRAKVEQKPADFGLFDLDARRQLDLVDAIRAAKQED